VSVVDVGNVTSQTMGWWHRAPGRREDVRTAIVVACGDEEPRLISDGHDVMILGTGGIIVAEFKQARPGGVTDLEGSPLTLYLGKLTDRAWVSLGSITCNPAGNQAVQIGDYLDRWIGRGVSTGAVGPLGLDFRPGNVRPLGAEEISFCLCEDLTDPLLLAISLAQEYLEPVQPLEVRLEQDPESEDEWLTLGVVVAGDSDTLLAHYEKYVREWVAQVPWPEVNRIRLSYDVAN
jgi:hypothetical protein